VTEYSDGATDAQETNMIRTFSGLSVGKVDPTWPEVALKTQTVMDACSPRRETRGAGQRVVTKFVIIRRRRANASADERVNI